MLNHNNTLIAYLTVLLIFIISGALSSTAGIVIISIITLFFVSLLATASARIQMNFFIKAVNNGSREKATVTLTFDDGPDRNITPQILEILEKHNIKATFFCIGEKIEQNRDILKMISDKGHTIGNHSWSHSVFFDFYLPGRMAGEIEKTDRLIKEITGKNVVFFRPPFGVTNPFLAGALKKTGHTVIGWSLRTFDTVKDKERILKKIETKVADGDILLFHDTVPQTVELLEKSIEIIKNKGMEIVGLEGLIV